MQNITISMQEDLLKAGRKYAQEHRISLNALIRQLLTKTILRSTKKEWLKESFTLMDRAKGNSRGKKWSREELYRG